MDDDSSIIAQPSKTPSCAACRTRESKKWWKAPKGLPTNILCDTCGSNWRKYADLNVRQFREESAPLKPREKREGTPIAGPSSKRAKVSATCAFFFSDLVNSYHNTDNNINSISAVDTAANNIHCCSEQMSSLSQAGSHREGSEVQKVWIQSSRRGHGCCDSAWGCRPVDMRNM